MTSTRVTMASVLPAGTGAIDDMTAEMAVTNATAVSLSRTEYLNTLSFVFQFLEGARYSSMVRAFAHGAMGCQIDPSWSYFSFQPVHHDWCNKGCGMCYPVSGMIHIKEPLLIKKNSPCGGSGFPLSLSMWFFTICLTPYNRK